MLATQQSWGWECVLSQGGLGTSYRLPVQHETSVGPQQDLLWRERGRCPGSAPWPDSTPGDLSLRPASALWDGWALCCRWGLREAGGQAGQQLLGVLLGNCLLEERLDIQGSLCRLDRQGWVCGAACAGAGVQGWVCRAVCGGLPVQGRPCPCPRPHPDSTTFPSLRLALEEAGTGFSPVGNI